MNRSPLPSTTRPPAWDFTSRKNSHRDGPSYRCITVRPCTVIAAAPRAKAPSKIAKNFSRLSAESSMPRRIFTVTGTCGGAASRTRLTISSATSGWLR